MHEKKKKSIYQKDAFGLAMKRMYDLNLKCVNICLQLSIVPEMLKRLTCQENAF